MCLLLQHDIIVHVHNCIKGFSRQWFTAFRSMFYWLTFICCQQRKTLLFSSAPFCFITPPSGRNRAAAVWPAGLTWPWPAPFIASFVLPKRLGCLDALLKMYKQENVVQTLDAEYCKHENKYLIVWLMQIKEGCVNTKQVHVHAQKCLWCKLQKGSSGCIALEKRLLEDRRARDRQSHASLLRLLGFSWGKWQINILFLYSYLLYVRGKASGANFIHTLYTI